MKINLDWLSDYIEIDTSVEMLAEDLTMAGLEVEGISEYEGDTILELSITPNRPDWLSHFGVARELAVIYGKKLKKPGTGLKESDTPVEAMASIETEDPKGCPRYSARIVTGIKIGPAPEKISHRLESVDVRSINNIVDATNYVMMELGQPLHAFDYNLLGENRIVVRRASSGEKLKTLDGQERTLHEEDLLICDGRGPVAIAGVMGGESSEVREDTVDLLLESACFDPVTIRRGSKRLGLSTEASFRFERGTDPDGTVTAVDRLAQLISEWAGGEICRGVLDVCAPAGPEPSVELRTQRVARLLGVKIPDREIYSLLKGLGLSVKKGKAGKWAVTPPGFRRDIHREEDIVEEVARIYGYQKIPATMPAGATIPVKIDPADALEKDMKSVMEALGFSEAVTYSFISRGELEDLGVTGGPEPVALLNPISEEMRVMRTSLLPGLLKTVKLNLARRRTGSLSMYEVGKTFLPCTSCEISEERLRITGVMTGARSDKSWYGEREAADFFDIKGVVVNLLSKLGIGDVKFMGEAIQYLHPGQGAWVMAGEKVAGTVGTLNPVIRDKYGISEWAGCFELDVEVLAQAAAGKRSYRHIPKYPGLLRDLALVAPVKVSSRDIEDAIVAAGSNLESCRLFDHFVGKNIPEGHRSLAYSLVFQSLEKTLTDDEVDACLEKILKALDKKLNVKLRV